MKIKLEAWAARRYDPAPSMWVLRKWVRHGEIHPAPELVGKTYYVDEHAKRLTPHADPAAARQSLVERLQAERQAA